MAHLQVCGKMGTQDSKVDWAQSPLSPRYDPRRCSPQSTEMAFPGSCWKSRSLPAPEETHITLLLWLNYCSSLLKGQNITHLKRPSFHSAPDAGCKSPGVAVKLQNGTSLGRSNQKMHLLLYQTVKTTTNNVQKRGSEEPLRSPLCCADQGTNFSPEAIACHQDTRLMPQTVSKSKKDMIFLAVDEI